MAARGVPPKVTSLYSRARYVPDVTNLACSRMAAARRQSGLSVAAFGIALEPLLGWLPDPELIEVWESTVEPPGQVMVAAEVIASHHAIVSANGHSVSSSAEADAAAMQAFREADLKSGGGHVYPNVVAYLQKHVAPRLVLDAGRGSVFTSASAVSEMAGWMAHDGGDDTAARQHFERALDFVKVGGDRQLTAHVQASIGHLAHHTHDASGAVRAARAGLETLADGPRNPDLKARLLAVEAKGYAALGDAEGAVRCLVLAEKALEEQAQEPLSVWVSGFDEGSLANDAARCMHQLGRLGVARQYADRVIELRPPNRPRSRAFGLFIQANVLVAQGSPDEASAVAAEILETTGSLGSHIVVQQFVDLRRCLKPHESSAPVRDFLEQLNPALRERLWTRPSIAGGAA